MKSVNICPYPGTCEFDDFSRIGEHFCARATCPYALSVRALLEERIRYLSAIPCMSQREIRLIAYYRRMLEEAAC
ncbi:MAG: hypothetical protein J6L72_07170 [Butyricicoccus sp.]|nr:hypothetical protein [Butyricicoccus sp.]